jgi:uncharacterized membrane protein HdeD (DUF308 family)
MRRVDLSRGQAVDVASLWWLFVLLGLLSAVAGVLLVLKPSNSLATLAVIFGIFLLIDGIGELIWSFSRGNENRGLTAIVGVLGVIVGIALIRHPFHGVAAIGILIGIWLVAAGVIRLVRALFEGLHPLLRCAIAIVEIIVGIVIVSDPHIGYATLAILTGIWLIINGVGAIAFGFAIRSAKAEESSPSLAAGRQAG